MKKPNIFLCILICGIICQNSFAMRRGITSFETPKIKPPCKTTNPPPGYSWSQVDNDACVLVKNNELVPKLNQDIFEQKERDSLSEEGQVIKKLANCDGTKEQIQILKSFKEKAIEDVIRSLLSNNIDPDVIAISCKTSREHVLSLIK